MANEQISEKDIENAKKQILLLKAKDEIAAKKRKRLFFILLDLIIIVSFVVAIEGIYRKSYINAALGLVTGIIPLVYFIVREKLRRIEKASKLARA